MYIFNFLLPFLPTFIHIHCRLSHSFSGCFIRPYITSIVFVCNLRFAAYHCLHSVAAPLPPRHNNTTHSTMSATASSTPSPSATSSVGSGQGSQGISFVAFITALVSSLVIFGIQMLAFILLKEKLARILYVPPPKYSPHMANHLYDPN